MNPWPITVYVPTWNQKPERLDRAVCSALVAGAAQVIVIDDGSDVPVRNRWGAPVEVHRIAHGGVPAAMNAAVPLISQRYFARLPSDDRYDEKKFANQLPWMWRYSYRATYTAYMERRAYRFHAPPVWPRLATDNLIYGATTIIDSDLIREIGGHKSLAWCHDWDFHCEIAQRTTWGAMEMATVYRGVYPDSLSATAPPDEYNAERARVLTYWRSRV